MQAAASIFVLQITDLHLLPDAGSRLLGVDTAASLDAVLAAALAERLPDAVIVTGDVAHTPTAATYARARALVEARFRGVTLWLAGNHDHGDLLSAGAPAANEINFGDWSVLAIDTHSDGVEAGSVAPAELQRLDAALANSRARHVVVVGHHPPLALGTPWLDSGRIGNGEALLELLSADPRVRAYACGHVHQASTAEHGALELLTSPSTCFQFVAGSERFSVDATPPGWRWLELRADGTLRSQIGRATGFAVTLDLSKFKKH
jgi:3',5'-cyclic-AMP phosphodiesterase